MNSLYKIWPGLVSKETCQEIIKCAMKEKLVQGTVSRDKSYIPEYRKSNILFIKKDNEDFSEIYSFIDNKFHDANSECFGVDLRRLQDLQFTEYDSSYQGHFAFHSDTFFDKALYQRKLSMVIQLSDSKDYEGGDFEFGIMPTSPPDKDLLRVQGTILVFPSFLMHKVNPVITGKRNSLVGWYEGLPWR
jgi:PKHD-type hydroxylase